MSLEIKTLTRVEEQFMQELWRLKKGFINDILENLPEPKPAYNTVSTIVRILEKKGFVGHKAYGKSHQYFPIISKKEYSRAYFGHFLGSYFSNSFQSLASFFAKEEKLSVKELEDLKEVIEEQIRQKKENEA